MIKLYCKGSMYSNKKLKDSVIVDIEVGPYYGLTLKCTNHSEGYYVQTIDGKQFKINSDNLSILTNFSTITHGRIITPCSWQKFKNIYMMLPENLLEDSPLQVGDIVVPANENSVFSGQMVYLGLKNRISYSGSMVKTVNKNQHIFYIKTGYGSGKLYRLTTINSIFFKIGSNQKEAEELQHSINFKHCDEANNAFFYTNNKVFYLDDFKGISIIPKIVKINTSISPNRNPTMFSINITTKLKITHFLFKNDNDYYQFDVNGAAKIANSVQSSSIVNALRFKNLIESVDEIDENDISPISFSHKKYRDDWHEVKLTFPADFNTVIYEIKQNGKVVGRK